MPRNVSLLVRWSQGYGQAFGRHVCLLSSRIWLSESLVFPYTLSHILTATIAIFHFVSNSC